MIAETPKSIFPRSRMALCDSRSVILWATHGRRGETIFDWVAPGDRAPTIAAFGVAYIAGAAKEIERVTCTDGRCFRVACERVSDLLLTRWMPVTNVKLTGRQEEVFYSICDGEKAARYCKRMGVGTSTYETHRAAIFERTAVNSNAELVRWAFRYGLID